MWFIFSYRKCIHSEAYLIIYRYLVMTHTIHVYIHISSTSEDQFGCQLRDNEFALDDSAYEELLQSSGFGNQATEEVSYYINTYIHTYTTTITYMYYVCLYISIKVLQHFHPVTAYIHIHFTSYI